MPRAVPLSRANSISLQELFDISLLASVRAGQSKYSNFEEWSCQTPCLISNNWQLIDISKLSERFYKLIKSFFSIDCKARGIYNCFKLWREENRVGLHSEFDWNRPAVLQYCYLFETFVWLFRDRSRDLKYTGFPRSGKSPGKQIFFKVEEKSGNLIIR